MRTRGLLATVGLLFSVLTGTALADHEPEPRLTVTSHGRTVEATLGTHCFTHDNPDGSGFGGCADSAYPLRTRGRVPVHPGGQVVLRTNRRFSRLHVSLVKDRGLGEEYAVGPVRRLDDTGRRWSVRLPRNFHGARTLDVWAVHGRLLEANFQAAVSLHRHRATGPCAAATGARQAACIQQ